MKQSAGILRSNEVICEYDNIKRKRGDNYEQFKR